MIYRSRSTTFFLLISQWRQGYLSGTPRFRFKMFFSGYKPIVRIGIIVILWISLTTPLMCIYVVVVQLLSHVRVTCNSFATLWIAARQALLSMGFPRQEYSSGLSFPFPVDLPDPEIEPTSPSLGGRFFTTDPPGKLNGHVYFISNTLNLYLLIFAADAKHVERKQGKGETHCVSVFQPGFTSVLHYKSVYPPK